MSNNCCQRAFSEIEITASGDIYTCCPSYLKEYSIGNIFNVKSFDEIWYSEKAIDLRKSIIQNNYKFCNTDICNKKINEEDILITEKPDYPTLVRFSYDRQCNLRCTICRDELVASDPLLITKFDSIIETKLLPILKNAKIMSITSAGDITASKHSQILLKKASEQYPNLKFEILTNALLFNKEFCESLGILDKIDRIVVSMHGMSKTTYENIMRGSNYDIVKKNLDWLFAIKNEQKINQISLVFVVSSVNYKELPDFVSFCIKNNATPIIWEYRPFSNVQMAKNYNKFAIWKTEHPYYNDFVKIIRQVNIENHNKCRMPEMFKNLKEISKYQEYKNKIKSLLRL